MSGPTTDNRYRISSLHRAIEVIERLARHRQGLSLAELARATDIPKSTLFRILKTLEDRRLIVADEETRAYRLGLRLWELGSAYLQHSNLDSLGVPYMKGLAEKCEESVFLGVIDGGEVVYIRRMESPKSVLVVRKLGQRAPAYCTATGTAIMAFLPEARVEDLLSDQPLEAHTARTKTDPEALRERLRSVRKKGVAVVDGEYNARLLCISAPVLDDMSRPCASLTVAMLSGQATEERVGEIKESVRQAARGLSVELGYLGYLGSEEADLEALKGVTR